VLKYKRNPKEAILVAIIHQHDKRTGLTYAYESHSYWDKEKKMTRAKRKLIGRVDPETGEIVPTDGRGRKEKTPAEKEPDYKALYKKAEKKCASLEVLVESLKKELAQIKGAD
jgi:hypothetical protein